MTTEDAKPDSCNSTTFSIIVPSHSRPDEVLGCLSTLAQLEYPIDRFEVILVDDGSARALTEFIRAEAYPFATRIVRQENTGPAQARNAGAEVASGNILAFTDDDCRPSPGWLTALEQELDRSPDAILGGRTVNGLPGNVYAFASQAILDMVYRHYNEDPCAARFFASNNLSMSRETFRCLGSFNGGFRTSEDREFCDRARSQGVALILVEQAIVRHYHDLSLGTFVLQHFGYGRGAYLFHKLRKKRGTGRMWSELSFHLNFANWLIRPFSGLSLLQSTRFALLLTVWQLANASGFLYQAARELLVASAPEPLEELKPSGEVEEGLFENDKEHE